MKQQNTTRKLVMTALLAALACVATMIVKIPSPFKGYLNLGDCVVLLAGWLLSPVCGFAAAGLGTALADVFSGFAVYAPATFVIKGLMALAAHFLHRLLQQKTGNFAARVVSGIAAEVIMVLGYFLFEAALYGAAPSALNIPANALQGLAGLVLGLALIKAFEKHNIAK